MKTAAEIMEALKRSRETPPDTLAEAKRFVEQNLASGTLCPCCGQDVKLYPRKLYADMAAWLIWLVGRSFEVAAHDRAVSRDVPGIVPVQSRGWVRASEHPTAGGDYGKLAHWGLAELRPKDPADRTRRTSGWWIPTEKGVAFVRGQILVPSHVMLFNSEVRGFSDEQVSIQQALGEKFSYSDLMQQHNLRLE